MLKERLSDDLKTAMRAKDPVRLRTIRSLRAALLELEIEERQGGEAMLSEDQELQVLQRQAKQRRDAITQYEGAGREDLAEKERAELAVIETYLPDQLSDEEVVRVLHQVIVGVGAASPRDMGKVMGEAIRLLRGRASGRRVQQLAQEMLSGLTDP
jgi:uncharacterized protein